MKNRKSKFTALLSATFFMSAALVWLAPVVARAQIILKPGEIIYGRFINVAAGEQSCDTTSVWAVEQDGSNDRRLFLNGIHPRISPDGRFIMFKRFPGGLCIPYGPGAEIWVRELATGRETLITNFTQPFGTFFTPETNRADNQIMFDTGGVVCRVNLDGTNRFCNNLGVGNNFTHPSVRGGDFLSVMANERPQPLGGLYTFNYNLTNPQKIPNTSSTDESPSWSNSGQTIAYGFVPPPNDNPPFYNDLYKINPDGSNKTRLTFLNGTGGSVPLNGFTRSLVWTTNDIGDEFIFNAARVNNVAGIYRIAADGSGNMSQIPITAGNTPDWVGGIVPVIGEQQVSSFGGGASSGDNFTLVDTAGQAFAGQTSTGGNFSFASGFWTLATTATGLEGDIAARPNGDGSVLANDVILVRRFFNGVSTPDSATNEFQRADSAPRSTSGDGIIGSNDVIQTRRYQNGIDPLQNAGGPTEGNFAPLVAKPSDAENQIVAPRELRVQSISANAGQPVTVNILVDALGDEAGYGFRLNYNNTRLLNPVIGAGNAGAAVRSCNQTTAGLNCAADTFPNNSPTSSDPFTGEIAPGNNQILMTITFTVAPNAPNGALPLTLIGVNASNDNADLLTITSVNGAVNVGGPTAANATVGGCVTTAEGNGIRNVMISLTDASSGETRFARSSSFGYYKFEDVPVGESYVLTVNAKRFLFNPNTRLLTVFGELTEVDFMALPKK